MHCKFLFRNSKLVFPVKIQFQLFVLMQLYFTTFQLLFSIHALFHLWAISFPILQLRHLKNWRQSKLETFKKWNCIQKFHLVAQSEGECAKKRIVKYWREGRHLDTRETTWEFSPLSIPCNIHEPLALVWNCIMDRWWGECSYSLYPQWGSQIESRYVSFIITWLMLQMEGRETVLLVHSLFPLHLPNGFSVLSNDWRRGLKFIRRITDTCVWLLWFFKLQYYI